MALVIATSSVSRHLLPGAFNDDAVYMALGRALANGDGYRSTYLVGAPLQVKFPPAFPALLAVLWQVAKSPGNVQAIATAINIAACGAAAGLFWWIGRVRLGMPAVLVACFAILPFLLDMAVQYFTLVLSEPLYLLAVAAALILSDRPTDRDEATSPRSRTIRAIALGVMLALAGLIRTQGIAVMVAILLAMALDRRRDRALIVATIVAAAPILAWHSFLALEARHAVLATQASESTYLTFMGGGGAAALAMREIAAVRGNVIDYGTAFAAYLSAWTTVGIVMMVLLVILAAIGAVLLFRTHRTLSVSLIASVAVLLAWPAYQDRYLVPVLPLFGLAAGYALHAIARVAGSRVAGRGPAMLATGLVTAAMVSVIARQITIRQDVDAAREAGRPPKASSPSYWLPGNAWFVETIARWTLRSTSKADRIGVVSPAGLWLYTGRQTVPMEVVEARGVASVFDIPGRYLASQLVSANLTLVLVERPNSPTARELAAVRAACPQALQPIQEFSGITAYRAVPGDACVAALDKRFQARDDLVQRVRAER